MEAESRSFTQLLRSGNIVKFLATSKDAIIKVMLKSECVNSVRTVSPRMPPSMHSFVSMYFAAISMGFELLKRTIFHSRKEHSQGLIV